MRTIWKFTLKGVDWQVIAMPEGAKILSTGIQDDKIRLWAEVVPERDLVEREILIFGTGHPMDSNSGRSFVGTVQFPGGGVYHVFEAAK